MPQKTKWKIISHKTVVKNRWTEIFDDQVVNPGGGNGSYIYAKRPDSALIIAQEQDKSIYLVKEYKYAIKEQLTKVPTGAIENGLSPWETAKKELFEETGLKAKKWKLLGENYLAPGFVTTKQYIFLATDLDKSQLGDHSEGDEEIIDIIKISTLKLKKMIIDSRIKDSSTLAALNLYFLS